MSTTSTDVSEIKTTLADLHNRIAAILTAHDTAALQTTMVTDQWNVLDAIGHINSWGLLFLDDARYMAKNPGKSFPYQIVSSTNFDAENEALVVRRRDWTVAEHLAENRRVSERISELVAWFDGEPPDAPVVVPTSASTKPMNIAALLRFQGTHGNAHLQDILLVLEK